MTKTLLGKVIGGGDHRWDKGYCVYCNQFDYIEDAIAIGWYDPHLDAWDTDAHKQEYIRSLFCPIVPIGVEPESLPFPLRESDYDKE